MVTACYSLVDDGPQANIFTEANGAEDNGITFLPKLHWNRICCEAPNSRESLDLLRNYLKYRWMNDSICWEINTFFYHNVSVVLWYFSDELTNHLAHSVILWKITHTIQTYSKRLKKKWKECSVSLIFSNTNKCLNMQQSTILSLNLPLIINFLLMTS